MKIRTVKDVDELSQICDYEDDWSGESFEISSSFYTANFS